MLAEALSALWLWIDARPESTYLWALNLGFLFGIWAVTFAVSVPCHRRLAAGYDEKVVNRLIRTNWLRTTFWTAKALIVVYSLIYGGV